MIPGSYVPGWTLAILRSKKTEPFASPDSGQKVALPGEQYAIQVYIMSLKIPYNLSLKVADFPESSSGFNQVTLILIDERKISEVYLAQGEAIVRIRNKSISGISDLDFSLFEIKDVISEV